MIPFNQLAQVFSELESTSKRLEKTQILSNFIKSIKKQDSEVLFLLTGRIYPEWNKTQLNIAAKTLTKALAIASGHSQNKVDELFKKEGDLGIVAQELCSHKQQASLFSQELESHYVLKILRQIADTTGAKSTDLKIKLIAQLFGQSTPTEAKYLARIILETMRTGSALSSMRDALVWSQHPELVQTLYPDLHEATAEIPDAKEQYQNYVNQVQRALDVSNDIQRVYEALLENKLDKLQPTLGYPLKAMLAQKTSSIKEGLTSIPNAQLEYKYDGFRIQIHIGKTIELFTRRLENVTAQFPDVVEYVQDLQLTQTILDAEVVGIDQNGNTKPFQDISQRIRRKYEIERLKQELPVQVSVFDILYYKESLLDTPLKQRRSILESVVPIKDSIRPSIMTRDLNSANEFYQQALNAGNEGIMIKSLDATYQPGNRVGSMLKCKPIMDTLDLVIVQAEWGQGKRTSWITSFTVACIEQGEFKTLGKVSTGLKEDSAQGTSFEEMTKLLQTDIISEKNKIITLRPNVVIEVAYEEIQKSTTYSSGYALRFPRFIRLREREIQDISTLEFVEELYHGQ